MEYADSEAEGEDAKWTMVGEMSKKRFYHAVSVVDFEQFKDYCR